MSKVCLDHTPEEPEEKKKASNIASLISADRFEVQDDDADYREDDEEDEDNTDVVDELPEPPRNYQNQRCRFSVSAEAYGDWNKKKAFIPPVYKKEMEQEQRIKSVLVTSFLFQHLDREDLQIILHAFVEKRIKKGEILIKQGDDGDSLYLIEHGCVDVFKQFPGESEPRKMCVMTAGDAVGELSLMYNCPRAATVIAQTDVVLWVLDRETFNSIVRDAAARRRELYESFLKEIEILKCMDHYELGKMSDALRSTTFEPNETIIHEGDVGDTFYIIESGKAVAMKNGKRVLEYGRGDYFGELALIKNQPRAATVVAVKEPVRCVSLDRRSFKRLLGPVEVFLKRNASRYDLPGSQLEQKAA